MFFLLFHIVGLLLSCSFITFAEHIPAYASPYWYGEKQHYRMDLRHIEAGGIGYNNGYTTVDGFVAPTPNISNIMPFLDLRAHVFDTGNLASNIGVGLRKIIGCRVYGVNSYYDYRNSEHTNYGQMSFGVETLGKRIDFRINAYLPLEKNIVATGQAMFHEFSGHEALLSQNYQFAMKGMNTNLGFHFGSNKICDFYACGGTYFYAGPIGEHIWGGKASLLIRFAKCFNIEISNSYDKMFFNRFQVSVGINIPFGKNLEEHDVDTYNNSDTYDLLVSRMTQPVQRQEILVLGQSAEEIAAINPVTGQPYRFVFVDNTSNSLGTYESPYHSLTQAQNNSGIGDIIYVYPGDGTTYGMDRGITLQNNQNLWGSGVTQTLSTAQGVITIPAQSTISPTITNSDIDSLGDGITLSSTNEVKGINIANVLNHGILGNDVKNLVIDRCAFEGSNVYAINTTSMDQAIVSITNNSFNNNINGMLLSFNETSTLLASGNTITNTTSESECPLFIISGENSFTATIINNTITDNRTGGLRFHFNNTDTAQITISNNIISNNETGSIGTFGASLFVNLQDTTVGDCQLYLTDNILSGNSGSALYCTQGDFNNFQARITGNMMTDNGGSGFVFNNNCDTFTLTATDNIISNGNDNGIATVGDITLSTANITLLNNHITGNTNVSNGIVFTHTGTNFDLTISGNQINNNEGTGILMYSTVPIENVTVNITSNSISDNQNLSANAAGGIDLEQFTNLLATITNNTLSENGAPGVYIGSTDTAPVAQVQLSGNVNDTAYILFNDTGTFDLAPCNVETVNTGTITTIGTVTMVQYCPDGPDCPL